MVVLKRCVLVFALAPLACGTLAPDGGGANELPESGAGSYTKLKGSAGTLLGDARASLDDAQLFVDGEALTVFFTRAPGDGTAAIRRARFPKLGEPASAVDTVLVADQPWEGGFVSQPAVLPPASDGDPWILCYASHAGIGCAASTDGNTFQKPRMPVAGNGLSTTASTASSPALFEWPRYEAGSGEVQVSIARMRLTYLRAGAIWAIDLDRDNTAQLALDPGPTIPSLATPVNGALIAPGAAPWLESIGRFTARTVHLPTGRDRYDLFLSGASAGLRVVGFAGSFDGSAFALAANPMLDPKAPEEWAPTVAAYGAAGSLLLFSQAAGSRATIGVAQSP
jgi:hypothetical protein